MLDRRSPLPLYYQLKQLLVERIDNGELEPGDMLPTERQLQEQHSLSRTTVRQAFRELEIEGRVTRYRGRGTFVAEPKVVHGPESRNSLTNFLIAQGKQPGWKLLSAEWMVAPPEVAERLQIGPEAQVHILRRLRLASDEPIGYHNAYVSPEFEGVIDKEALTKGGSLAYLRSTSNLEGSTANRTLEAIGASEEEANLLNIDKGAPLMLVRRLVISADGRPVEDFRGVYRGDRFQYQISSLPTVDTTTD